MVLRLGVAVFVGALISVPSAALAGPIEAAAAAASKKGSAAFNLGAYDEAAKHYEESYRLVQDPSLLYNIGQSYRLAGKPERALTAYRSYLRTAPSDVPHREQVERRIRELERIAAETSSTQTGPPPGTLPSRSEMPPAPSPTPAAIVAQPAPPLSDAPAPIYKRWLFWAGAATIVTGAVVTAVLLSGGDTRATTCGAELDFCAPVRR